MFGAKLVVLGLEDGAAAHMPRFHPVYPALKDRAISWGCQTSLGLGFSIFGMRSGSCPPCWAVKMARSLAADACRGGVPVRMPSVVACPTVV